MRIFYVLSIGLFLLTPMGLEASSKLKLGSISQVVDFGLLYPYVTFKSGMARSQKVTAGVSANYHYYFLSQRFGVSGNIYAWFQPVRAEGTQETLYSVGLEIGPSVRLFPDNYFDPTLSAYGGIAAMDAGSSREGKFPPTVSGRLGFNLWRQQQKFTDNELALHMSGSFIHHFTIVPNSIDKNAILIGLFFRGSF